MPTTSWMTFVVMRTIIRRIYITNIIGLAMLETAIYLIIKWLVPLIFIEITNWIISKLGRQNTVANAAVHFSSSARPVQFDTDSFLIGVDTHATQCISPNIDHFQGLTPMSNQFCQGFEGQQAEIKGKGTLIFRIEDDNGAIHSISIPNSLYIPTATRVLLIQQH